MSDFVLISHPQLKNCQIVSHLELIGKRVMLFIVLFSVVTTFSNFQATFRLISPKTFGMLTPNFRKI